MNLSYFSGSLLSGLERKAYTKAHILSCNYSVWRGIHGHSANNTVSDSFLLKVFLCCILKV